MGKRGIRSQKGQPESEWGEPKTGKITVALTETGKQLAKERSDRTGFSLSEILERWGRGVSVDGENATLETTANIRAIIKALPRLSKPQLIRLVWACLTLLLGKPEPEPDLMTVEEEINAADPQELGDKAGIPPERISHIQEGGDIFYDELIKLARVFKIKPSELRDQLPNHITNGCNT
jgi:hypothetical protein